MEFEREIFHGSGLEHLTAVDWNNVNHQRCVAASLVQGVYTHERDRQNKRLGPQAVAPPWWKSFDFQLKKELKVDADSSIFGIIYEFRPQASYHSAHSARAPKYVVAFRGTLWKRGSWYEDTKNDILILLNSLNQSPHIEIATRESQKLMATGAADIWLAGHSLGSARAMLVGKNMAKMNCPIETYLFNPPFISFPIECIKNPKVKHAISFVHSLFKVTVDALSKCHHESSQDYQLSRWIPNLFVNPEDPVCNNYIEYFEHRKLMKKKGAGKIERRATKISIRGLLFRAHGNDSEPLHLLPSANLTINRSPSQDCGEKHGIEQWFRLDIHCQHEQHQPSGKENLQSADMDKDGAHGFQRGGGSSSADRY